MNQPVSLVTGARKGLGRHFAEHYLARGHKVIGVSRTASDLSHPDYEHVALDVTDEPAVLELFKTIRQRLAAPRPSDQQRPASLR